MRKMRSAAAILAIVLTIAASGSATASESHLVERGPCRGGPMVWRLELTRKNGRIRVDFELSRAVVNNPWRIRVHHNDHIFFSGWEAPDMALEIHIREKVRDASGRDAFLLRAGAHDVSGTCKGSVNF